MRYFIASLFVALFCIGCGPKTETTQTQTTDTKPVQVQKEPAKQPEPAPAVTQEKVVEQKPAPVVKPVPKPKPAPKPVVKPKPQPKPKPVVKKKPAKKTVSVVAPKETLIIKAPKGVKAKKAPVPFSHIKHEAVACTDCHHTWDQKSKIKSCTAAGCHDIFVAKTSEEKRSIRKYDKAYHKSCMDCHKALKKANKPTGPIKCNDCHAK